MLKIIELLIDEHLSGETRVEEVALVEFPAIEVDAIFFSKQKFYRAPEYVSRKACQAIKENEKRGNPAGTQVGKVRAQQLCKRDDISYDTIKRMKSFLERASVYDTGNWDDNGTIAMGLWGGEEALVWVDKIIQQEETKREEMDYDTTGLPTYDQYPSGDTKNNMLIEPVLFVKVKPGESESDYVGRCMGSQDMVNEFPDQDQRSAVCYSTWERKDEFDCGCMEREEMEIEPNPCWDGYEPYGLKDDGSPNCIPVQNSKQDFELLGYIDGIPYFSSPQEAEEWGKENYGCDGHHVHTDEEGNEIYMSCKTHDDLPDGGVELEELLSKGWRIESWNEVQKQEVYNEQFRCQVSQTTKEEFYRIVTDPNGPSNLDFGGRKVRFVYLVGKGPDRPIPTTREFCNRMTGGRQFVFRYEDIVTLNAQITAEDSDRKIIPRPQGTQPDIFTWKGGANCRHYWAELTFSTDNPTEDEYTERINNDAKREMNKASLITPAVGQSGQVNPKASSVRGTRDGA